MEQERFFQMVELLGTITCRVSMPLLTEKVGQLLVNDIYFASRGKGWLRGPKIINVLTDIVLLTAQVRACVRAWRVGTCPRC